MSKNNTIHSGFQIIVAIFLLLCWAPLLVGMDGTARPLYRGEQDSAITDDAETLPVDGVSSTQRLDTTAPLQTADDEVAPPSFAPEPTQPIVFEPITGFGAFRLGATPATVRQLVEVDELFDNISANNISTDPSGESVLLLATGTDHITQAYFQFSNNALVVITLFVDFDALSYHTLLSSFMAKYGEPLLFSPTLVRWQSNGAQLELDNQNIVKYADTRFLASRIESSELQQSERVQRNQEVIDLF